MNEKPICPLCDEELDLDVSFCPNCGSKLEKTTKKGLFRGLKITTKGISEKAVGVKRKVEGSEAIGSMISQEKTSKAVRKLLDVVTQVSQDIKSELPSDMIKAVDLSAEISFIAFTIGVQIDLEQIPLKRKEKKIPKV
jgi:hypothetical protein